MFTGFMTLLTGKIQTIGIHMNIKVFARHSHGITHVTRLHIIATATIRMAVNTVISGWHPSTLSNL